ncbi:MAG: GNAT family N-acetyltransferase [Bacillota bacterium]
MEEAKKIEVRIATKDDIPDFYRLWKTCFADSDAFCDWLFSDRFYPEYAVVLAENGTIVSTMQAVPYTVMVRGIPVKATMLCGVCTHPDHRKKGYMQQIFTYAMQNLYEKDFVIAVHTPAVLESYFSFGHYPVADALYLKCGAEEELYPSQKPNLKSKLLAPTVDSINFLHKFYTEEMTSSYSGIIARTKEEFAKKWKDYRADSARCFALFEETCIAEPKYYDSNSSEAILSKVDELVAYAYFYEVDGADKKLFTAECVAKKDYYNELISCLLSHAKDRTAVLKLPPDLQLDHLPYRLEYKQKGVAGCVNISLLLQSLDLDCDLSIALVDRVIPENNGVFDMKGNLTETAPTCKMDCGKFLGVLIGYETVKRENCIEIYNETDFITLEKIFKKCICYIIDEY